LHQGIQLFRDSLRPSADHGHTTGPPNIDIVWKPYQIDPNIDMNGELFDVYCQRRWGGSQWTNHLRHEGKKDGCNFSNWKYICNTIRAHQLILYGTKYHPNNATCTTDAMNAALFEALYEEGLNISQVDTLVTIGSKLFGSSSEHTTPTFNAEHLRAYLEQHQGRLEVETEIKKLQQTYRVRGVPAIHIGIVEPESDDAMGTKWKSPPLSLSGAQPAEVFVEIFQELLSEM
jgi:predicted DsbA family dithiol-disulfide isomerase